MRKKTTILFLTTFFIILCTLFFACTKDSGGGSSQNPCAGVTITVTGTANNATSSSAADGSISVSASGSSGFTYKLNSSSFQSGTSFTGLSAGTYTITAKDANGCTGSKQFIIAANDPCTSVSFTVSGTPTASTPCSPSDGSITVSTSGGGSGFTYNINNGTFGVSPTFNNLAPGNYTVGAKEAGGCVRTAAVTIDPKPAGTLFLAVKNVITANCAISGCHNGTQAPNFTNDCNIVANAALIKQRAVDGTPSFMPPTGTQLQQADKDKIVNWVNAGGGYTN